MKILRGILSAYISPFQVTLIFEGGMGWIVVNSLIDQDVPSTISKNNIGKWDLMGSKLDMQRAYDKVEYKFLIQIMQTMGFFKEISLYYLVIVSYSNMLNGSPHGNFLPEIIFIKVILFPLICF